jgi:hypothetical protein
MISAAVPTHEPATRRIFAAHMPASALVALRNRRALSG